MKLSLLLILAAIFIGTNAYTGAVIDHSPNTILKGNDRIKKNVEIYRKYMDEVSNKNINIIVFPEYGLTGKTEEVEKYALEVPDINTDKTNYEDIIKELSDMAVERSMYLVVNILEKNNDSYYNTNVVFDKKGGIIAKYRKINLNEEPNLTRGKELVWFDTDFGVSFGLITNDDIYFYNPSKTILNRQGVNISNVIVPMSWNNVYPLQMATSVQAGYAQEGINVLASNLIDPELENAIFSGFYSKNYTTDFYNPSKNIILFYEHDMLVMKRNVTNIYKPLHNSISEYYTGEYKSELFIRNSTEVLSIVGSNLICKTSVNFIDNSTRNEYLRFVLASTNKEIGGKKHDVKICVFALCENDDMDLCGNSNNNVLFNSISMELSYNVTQNSIVRPITLDLNYAPIRIFYENKHNKVILKSENITDGVAVFGVQVLTQVEFEIDSARRVSINVMIALLTAIFLIVVT